MTKGSAITGSKDAYFLVSHYQPQLDTYDREIIYDGHKVQDTFKKLSNAFNKAQGLKKDIEAHEVERERAYDALGNLLSKEANFEKEMWKETSEMHKAVSKNQQAKAITIKQSLRQSDDNEMRFAAMMRYVERYPQYQHKDSIQDIRGKIKDKEREIRHCKRDYNDAVSYYNSVLSDFIVLFGVTDNKVKEYHRVLDEASEKLKNTRFHKGIFGKMAGEEKKAKTTIRTLHHRVTQFEERLNAIKNELSQYKGRKFTELDY